VFDRLINDAAGVSTIVVQLAMAVLILTLVLVWLGLKNSSGELISDVSNSTSREDKLMLSNTLELAEAGNVFGSDVVSDIRYAKQYDKEVIIVNNDNGTQTYNGETYDCADFEIIYTDVYTCVRSVSNDVSYRTYSILSD